MNQTSRFRESWFPALGEGQGQVKGIVIGNLHMKYQCPITYTSRDIVKVNIFEK